MLVSVTAGGQVTTRDEVTTGVNAHPTEQDEGAESVGGDRGVDAHLARWTQAGHEQGLCFLRACGLAWG